MCLSTLSGKTSGGGRQIWLTKRVSRVYSVTGGEHDLIAWDPRGTADTLTFSCFPDVEARGALTGQFTMGNASDVERGRNWALGKLYADNCAEYPEAQERGPLINTAFTARDAMQIVDQVEEDGLLRYWGECFSIRNVGVERSGYEQSN